MKSAFFIIADSRWVLGKHPNPKRIKRQFLLPLGHAVAHLEAGCNVLAKFRNRNGELITDDASSIRAYKGQFFLYSKPLCEALSRGVTEELIAVYLEGTSEEARCIVQPCDQTWIELLREQDPSLRLSAFDLPPTSATTITSPRIVDALYSMLSSEDGELYAEYLNRFLNSPHILTSLFSHVLTLRSEDDLNFLPQLKKIAEQIRGLLLDRGKAVTIRRIEKSHLELWAEMEGHTIGFLDGGVARIPGIARLEPQALRVGIYSVVPGERDIEARETWYMKSFLIGDCLDPAHPIVEFTDRRRLMEAARYTFEPLTALRFLSGQEPPRFLLMHGPLVNQFVMYDEGEPHHIPALAPKFLEEFGIYESEVLADLEDLPDDPKSGKPFWNQFMAVYSDVMKRIYTHDVPIAGVVERAAGRSVIAAVLQQLAEEGAVNHAYTKKIGNLLEKFDIRDDFIFGCVLREGEYITPLLVNKNLERRARDRWRPVVRQIPSPVSTIIKTEDTAFPFRIEMNHAANVHSDNLLRLVFHTARLLPRYAFPVGLDIADKYAKIPDWISKGISGEISAMLIRSALNTGDPRVVAQAKQLLLKQPRDFFFRPGVDI